MLKYYGYEDRYEQVKTWYDGYSFGKVDVYCPWDVINYCAELRLDPDAVPRAYWVNTSRNGIIRKLLQMAALGTRQELERLVNGETVSKRIGQELTYRELYESTDNVWSVPFTTGYFTRRGKADGDVCQLAIPNYEIRQIFIDHILEGSAGGRQGSWRRDGSVGGRQRIRRRVESTCGNGCRSARRRNL